MKKYIIGYVPNTYKGNDKFKIKASFDTKEEAVKERKVLEEKGKAFNVCYSIWTAKQVQEQWDACTQKSKEKRKKTIASKTPEQKKKKFILCPRCGSTSKLLYSEFGGLQTRRCKNGHSFEYDKWIGDRIGSIMLFGNPVAAAEFIVNNPTITK